MLGLKAKFLIVTWTATPELEFDRKLEPQPASAGTRNSTAMSEEAFFIGMPTQSDRTRHDGTVGHVHEFSIATGLVQRALQHARGRRVTVVNLRVGPLRQVVPGTLALAFDLAARGTACEGARLEQELVPCRLRCPSCAVEWTLVEPDFRCRRCRWPATVLSGNELQLESIVVEEEERACTG